jgi:hypothetical protein
VGGVLPGVQVEVTLATESSKLLVKMSIIMCNFSYLDIFNHIYIIPYLDIAGEVLVELWPGAGASATDIKITSSG